MRTGRGRAAQESRVSTLPSGPGAQKPRRAGPSGHRGLRPGRSESSQTGGRKRRPGRARQGGAQSRKARGRAVTGNLNPGRSTAPKPGEEKRRPGQAAGGWPGTYSPPGQPGARDRGCRARTPAGTVGRGGSGKAKGTDSRPGATAEGQETGDGGRVAEGRGRDPGVLYRAEPRARRRFDVQGGPWPQWLRAA